MSSETVSYYLSRSTGIVALVLMVLALVGGLLFSGRAAPRWGTPAWWLDLHNYLGGLALIFTAVHLATVYADTLSGVGLVQILVPHTAQRDRTAITLGVAATYCAAATVFTTWPRRLAPRRVWLAVHLTSGPAACAAAAHAWMAGSSRGGLWVEAGLAAMVGLAVYGLMLRINRTWRRRFGPGPARVRR